MDHDFISRPYIKHGNFHGDPLGVKAMKTEVLILAHLLHSMCAKWE
jgi:hypothetical protein